MSGMVQHAQDFEGRVGGDPEPVQNQPAHLGKRVGAVRWPDLGQFGELQEAIKRGVKFVEEAERRLRMLAGDGGGDRIDVPRARGRMSATSGRAFQARRDSRLRDGLVSAARRAFLQAASIGSAGRSSRRPTGAGQSGQWRPVADHGG